MKKMLIVIATTTLLASCGKKESVQPAAAPNAANVAIESVSRIPPWDLGDVSYVQSRTRPTATVNFSVVGGGAGGSGNIWVAPCNSANQIAGSWNGPFAASSYSATFNPGIGYSPGSNIAIFFDPGGVLGTGGPLFLWPGYGTGYTVNSGGYDAMNITTVQ